MSVNTNVNIPYSEFLDPNTKRPSREWVQWLLNPQVYNLTTTIPIGTPGGGTGVGTIPTNGQLLIGNGTGYNLNTISAGSNITVVNTPGNITISSGSGSLTAGSYGSASTSAIVTVGVSGFLSSISSVPIALAASQITSGILGVSYGGTGVNTIGTYRIPYGNGSSALLTSSNLTYDGFIFKALADIQVNKTISATTGAQTIDKTSGSVILAIGATSLMVTNALVTTSSIILATVASNDATTKTVAIVAAAGSFTIYANAAATAATRVNFLVLN